MLILNIFPLHTNLAGVGERAVGGGADGVECGGAYGGADLQAFRIVMVDHNSGLHTISAEEESKPAFTHDWAA